MNKKISKDFRDFVITFEPFEMRDYSIQKSSSYSGTVGIGGTVNLTQRRSIVYHPPCSGFKITVAHKASTKSAFLTVKITISEQLNRHENPHILTHEIHNIPYGESKSIYVAHGGKETNSITVEKIQTVDNNGNINLATNEYDKLNLPNEIYSKRVFVLLSASMFIFSIINPLLFQVYMGFQLDFVAHLLPLFTWTVICGILFFKALRNRINFGISNFLLLFSFYSFLIPFVLFGLNLAYLYFLYKRRISIRDFLNRRRTVEMHD